MNVQSVTSMHGVAIDGGDAEQVVPFIGWEIRLQHSGAADKVDLQFAFVNATLDGAGHWEHYTSLDQNKDHGVGSYSTRALAEIFQNNVSKASFDHTHNWSVEE